MMELENSEMVRAMESNDAGYDGKFYTGVHSTGIYCLPSCPARTPLLKNVVFYLSREEAIGAGLRGCKRCHSETYPDILPQWLHQLIRSMIENRNVRLTESKLMRFTGVDISTIRRHFQNHLDITPLAFHRKLRLNHARGLIERGNDYLSVAYDCGWESSSAFREAFSREFGFPPGRVKCQIVK